jgi:hypothetical protein
MMTAVKRIRVPAYLAGALIALSAAALRADDFQGSTHMVPFDEDTIRYSKTKETGPVARLQEKLDKGELQLKHDARFGYLPSVLEALGVPKSSQMLVFSKTSFQRERIAPRTPRSVFFGDNVYVGYVQGSPLMELTSVDPKLGGVFYTLEQKESDRPTFTRMDQCLECHASAKTMGVPGHLLRSFETDEAGTVDLQSGVSLVNQRTPMAERWGGWYVTGTHGSQLHRGNLVGKDDFERQKKSPNFAGNVLDLSSFFNVSACPEKTSDIVALMVMEHQSHMHNFLTRVGYEAEMAMRHYGHVNYLKNITEAFMRYLLFTEEAALTAPVKGNSEFTRVFASAGPRDKQGRSLRDFDLNTRLFKFPCSYLIYSPAFDSLPDMFRAQVYRRLFDILTTESPGKDFQGIAMETRRVIFEILLETKPNLPKYFRYDEHTAVAETQLKLNKLKGLQ